MFFCADSVVDDFFWSMLCSDRAGETPLHYTAKGEGRAERDAIGRVQIAAWLVSPCSWRLAMRYDLFGDGVAVVALAIVSRIAHIWLPRGSDMLYPPVSGRGHAGKQVNSLDAVIRRRDSSPHKRFFVG